MKTCLKNLLCFFALSVTSASLAADFPDAILADGPLAYYRLNESVLTPTFDRIVNSGTLGAAVNGIYSSTVTHPVPGILPANGAASANGTVLSVAYNAGLNPAGAFTIEAWLKPTVTNAAGVLTCALSSMHAASPRTGWLIYQSDTGWNFRMYNGVDANTTISITGGGSPVAGNWYHLVVSFDGTTARMYVNGVAGPSAAPAAFVQNSDSAFNIGSRSDNGFGWNGTSDEVALYPSALSASDAAAHNAAVTTNAAGYAAQVLASSPAGYWRLDETVPAYAGAVNSGSLGAAANGSYISGVTNTAGPSGPAFPGFEANNASASFDGTSGSVQFGNVAALNFEGPITLAAWVKPASQSPGLHNVISHGYTLTPNGEMMMRRNGVVYDFGSWNGTGYGIGGALMPVEDVGNWVFMVGTYDGVNWKLYHDGVELLSTASTTGSLLVNAPWGIGSRGGDLSDGRFFDGEIDEAAIFNKSMTAGHVLSLYFAAIGSNSPPFMVTDPPVVNPVGTIYATTPFSITADVSGSLPLSYQWRHAGTNLPGATALTYSRASAGLSDSGNYEVVTTNAFGAITSLVATVTVDPAVPTTIDQQPVSRSVYVGGQASFRVAASGTLPITYQWKHSGTNLPGATNSTVYITNCNVAETGPYTVGVSNVAGGLISSPAAILSLITPAPGSYEERVVGFRPLAYWRLNENSGPTAFDYLGGYDGTASGGVTPATVTLIPPLFPGLEAANTGYGFDGSGTVQIGNPAGLSFVGQITMAAWIKPASQSVGLRNILSHGYTTSPNGEMMMRRNGTIYEAGSWPTGGGVAGAMPATDVGNWVFLVGTFDGFAWRLYRNAALIGTTFNAAGMVVVNAGWAIGSRGDYSGDERFFDGDIDEAMIFNKALTSQEICALYNRAVGFNGSVDPTITLINGTGNNTVTNESFNTDGGFTFITPTPSTETDWTYTGTSWRSDGQASGLGSDNVSFLISPAYTMTRAGVVKLTFNHRHSFEADTTLWDGGAVDISINGGAYTRVAALSFDQNGYNGTVGSAPSLSGQQAFTGNSAGHPAFITSSCVLAGVQIGDTVRVRFVTAYDNNTTGNLTPPGWEIDSFQLVEGGSGAVYVACPCGTLQQSVILGPPWIDAGNPVLIETKSSPQRFFRVKP